MRFSTVGFSNRQRLVNAGEPSAGMRHGQLSVKAAPATVGTARIAA